jgi:hypothetical protein
MVNKVVKFMLEVEHPLPIPGETCKVTFLGRAEVSFSQEPKGWLVQITNLWYGVAIPTEEVFSWQVRKVELPKGAAPELVAKLDMAAIDSYLSPEAITLPDEKCTPLDHLASFLKPHPIVS